MVLKKGEHTKNGYDKTVRILSHHINTIKDLQKRLDILEEILHAHLPVIEKEKE